MFDNNLSGSVRFENVVKRFGNFTAIKKLSLTIKPGELVTLLGPSGCGKTTTLRLVAGLESPSEGKIFIGDKDVTHLNATHRNVSMVFQSYALFPHMTVLQNVSYGLEVNNTPKNETRQKALAGLSLVGLSGMESRLPSELSGGQQQRVAVARAIVLEPEVLLLDEPLSNLDAKLRRTVREEIRQIQQKLGFTALYVTHDQEEAMAVSDQIIVMKDTQIVQQGSPLELYAQPNSEFIANFIGDANIINCDIFGIKDTKTLLKVADLEMALPNNDPDIIDPRLIVRPQNVAISATKTDASLAGVISYAAYLGDKIQYTVNTEVGEIFIVDYNTSIYHKKDSSVFLNFDLEKMMLVEASSV